MQAYLGNSEFIDWRHPGITAKAAELSAECRNKTEIAKRCFEFVRDEIRHSRDFRLDPVTCKASDVLQRGTGYCYAKSHLLAALMRANGIPAGLCYQRLSKIDSGPPYCLHGLNAVYLPETGWYRIDARGNKPGVDAQFTPPVERLAFSIVDAGEIDLSDIYTEPRPEVIKVLTESSTWQEVYDNLPDIS